MSGETWFQRPEMKDRDPRPVDWCTGIQPEPRSAFSKGSNFEVPEEDPHETGDELMAPPDGGLEEMASPAVEQCAEPALKRVLEQQVLALKSAARDLSELNKEVGEKATRAAVDLGLVVAEELAAGAINIEPERILRIVEEATHKMDHEAPVRIRIAGSLLTKLEEMEEYRNESPWDQYEIVVDEDMGTVGCIVDSEYQHVDARITARLDQLRHALNSELGQTNG